MADMVQTPDVQRLLEVKCVNMNGSIPVRQVSSNRYELHLTGDFAVSCDLQCTTNGAVPYFEFSLV